MRQIIFIRIIASVVALLGCTLPALAKTGDRLNRNGLTQTFSDDFNNFSWYAEGDVKKVGGGTWRTNFGYTWVPVNDLKNHTLIWNGEEQMYVDPGFTGSRTKTLGLNPFSIKNGVLNITTNKIQNSGLYGYKYTSGLITTEPSFTQTYGVFEMRAKFPKGKGFWPAFWLLAADKEWPPELDPVEWLGREPTKYYTGVCWKDANGATMKSSMPTLTIPDASLAFHTYGMEWTPTDVIFYFDDKEMTRWPTPATMHKPMYLLANLALGGDWAQSPDATTKFPSVMEIDFIRAYKRDKVQPPAVITPTPTTPPGTPPIKLKPKVLKVELPASLRR